MRSEVISLKVHVLYTTDDSFCTMGKSFEFSTKQRNVGEALRQHLNKDYDWTIATYTMADGRQGTLYI